MESIESTLCKVLKETRIYGKGYKAGDTLMIENRHLNHYGRSIEPIKEKTETKKGDKE